MSLRVWLPLTKDLRNQGLDDVTVTNNGATFDANGKLGGCYEFTSGKRIQTTLPASTSLNAKAISFACWIYVTSWNSSYDCFMSIADNTYWNTSRATLCRNSTASTLVWNIADGTNRAYVTTTTALSLNTWTHVVGTYDGTNLKIYINGVLNNTSATTLSIGYAGTFNIGGWSGNNYPFNGYLNDVRIYNHCLSPLEVKQISQGLILHYPLNRGGWGQENLLKNTDFNGIAQKYTLPSGSEGGFTYTPSVTIPANTTYTVSCRMRGSANMTLYKLCTGGNESVIWVNKSDLSTTEYKPISITFTSPGSSKTLNQIYICTRYGYSSVGDWFEIAPNSLKMELGSKATPWCPNSSDELATTMGLNNNIEYDTSGYCNNGTRIGTFSWTSNTPKYNVSTVFNGTDNAIQTPSLPSMISDKNYTIAVWIYKTVIGSKGYQTIYGGPSGFEIEARNGSANETKFVPWNWGKPMASYELNEWNHCVFVHSDSDCKIYLNGEYIATGTAKASNPSGNYFVGAWNTATQQNFDGLMSDFRIYATALSADDVKSLYNNSAYIDNQGNIYGAVYEEV